MKLKKYITTILFVALSFLASAQAADSKSMKVVKIDASKYQDEYENAVNSDPWRGFNTAMFRFNDGLDQFLLTPLARVYKYTVPQAGRDRIKNAYNNLGEPVNLVNSLLQGDIEGVFRSFWRFTINSTFGVGGIGDVAGGFGLQEKERSFSQTLAVYGLGSGPYLVVPFMGPSTPRDLVGDAADMAANPETYFSEPYNYIADGGDVIQTREGLLKVTDDMRANSFDLYSSYKSAYLQNRKKKVLDTLE